MKVFASPGVSLSLSSKGRGRFRNKSGCRVVSLLLPSPMCLIEYRESNVPTCTTVILLFFSSSSSRKLSPVNIPGLMMVRKLSLRWSNFSCFKGTKVPGSISEILLLSIHNLLSDIIQWNASLSMEEISLMCKSRKVHWDRLLKTLAESKVMAFPTRSTVRASAGMSWGTSVRPQ